MIEAQQERVEAPDGVRSAINNASVGLTSLQRMRTRQYGRQEPALKTTSRCRDFVIARLALSATILFSVPFLSAQQSDSPITMNAALVYARQHSPRLSSKRQSIKTEQAAIAVREPSPLPRLTLGAAARGSTQPAQTAMGFPLTQLAQIPEVQPFSKGHLNADVRATIPVYTGGRTGSAVSLAQAQRDLAKVGERDVERDLDFEVTSPLCQPGSTGSRHRSCAGVCECGCYPLIRPQWEGAKLKIASKDFKVPPERRSNSTSGRRL